ncbi:MAG: LysR family transcriptional regulator, partial [Bdellovibrionales bacterium]|nr:LysR family transcriptional regulator [Bdellovibrionales bacterium]
MIPTSTDITYFLEVATTQNLSRAAERLGISQPSLTLSV